MSNLTPKGFEYHYPKSVFDEARANWYLNYENMEVFIYGTGKTHPLFFNKVENYLFTVVNDSLYKGDHKQLMGLFEYLAEKILLDIE